MRNKGEQENATFFYPSTTEPRFLAETPVRTDEFPPVEYVARFHEPDALVHIFVRVACWREAEPSPTPEVVVVSVEIQATLPRQMKEDLWGKARFATYDEGLAYGNAVAASISRIVHDDQAPRLPRLRRVLHEKFPQLRLM